MKKNRLIVHGRRPRRSAPVRGLPDPRARRELLEAAGEIFAEKGFERATGREICQRAGTNAAAINYYFGGMAGLYAAVVREANSRLVSFDALSAAVAGKSDAEAKLEALLAVFVRAITGPAASTWVIHVMGREIVSPTPELEALREAEILPKRLLVRSLVSELLELPEDHPAVAHGCVSVMAPCLMLLVCDRRTLKRRFPFLTLGSPEALLRDLVTFSLAGLAAIAKDARSKQVR
jgi:AcrR family transcriptional regulator